VGRRNVNDTRKDNCLELDLFGPGMTPLHRVGLAGLWMTLKRFEEDGIHLEAGDWELTDRRITLRWDEKGPEPLLRSMFAQAFKVDENDLIHFTALGEPAENPDAALIVHEGVLGTFLQHGRTRKAEPAGKITGVFTVQIDDDTYPYSYQRVYSYKHQNAAEIMLSKKGRLRRSKVVGWHYPGGTVRHNAFGLTALSEPPERMLALLFAPVGAIYFRIRKRFRGVKPQFALVLPYIADLPRYARFRQSLQHSKLQDLYASGTADAGWKVLAVLQAERLLRYLRAPACRIISFGSVPWSSQQKTRVEVFTVDIGAGDALKTYRLASSYLGNTYVKPQEGEPFWYIPVVRGLIASNLATGKPWYSGFADLMHDKAVRNSIFRYERKGIFHMVKQASFPEEAQRTFVEACHEAWYRRLGQLAERSRTENVSFDKLVQQEREKWRTRLSRSKNAAGLRETITDYWARSGSLSVLREHWQDVLPLFDDTQWRLGRDLALLALASYQPATQNSGVNGEVQDEPIDAEGA